VYHLDEWSCQTHHSSISTCRITLDNLSTRSFTESSSYTNNLIHHFQASPFTHIIFVSAMVASLFSANLKSLRKLASSRTLSSHGSLQSKVDIIFPTSLLILSTNHPSFTKPASILILFKFSHHTDPHFPSLRVVVGGGTIAFALSTKYSLINDAMSYYF